MQAEIAQYEPKQHLLGHFHQSTYISPRPKTQITAMNDYPVKKNVIGTRETLVVEYRM